MAYIYEPQPPDGNPSQPPPSLVAEASDRQVQGKQKQRAGAPWIENLNVSTNHESMAYSSFGHSQ